MRAIQKLAPWLVACLALAAKPAAAQSIWAEMPSAEELGKFNPPVTDGPQSGVVRVQCDAAMDGRLSACRVLHEEPAGAGFGEHALTMATKFRLTPEAARELNGTVVIPIRFETSDDPPTPPERDAIFQSVAAYRHLGDAGPYYPDRALRTGAKSVVTVDCRVGGKGDLESCQIADAPNREYGFDLAVLKMIERRWMTAGPPPQGVAAPTDGVWRFRVVFAAGRRVR